MVKALGTTNYDIMFDLTDCFVYTNSKKMIEIIDGIHSSGKDLKQFIKGYIQFVLDVNKYALGCNWDQLSLPNIGEYEVKINKWIKDNDLFTALLNLLVKIDAEIKYSSSPKYEIEARMLLFIEGGE